MYVLMYVNQDKQPCFIQGNMAEINERLRTLWLNDEIDQEDWEYYSNYNLLAIEDGQLTNVENWNQKILPHIEVA